MQLHNQAETVRQRLNELGRAGVPFLFLADFELKKPEILLPTEIDPLTTLFQIGRFSNLHQAELAEVAQTGQKVRSQPLYFSINAPSFAQYQNRFDKVIDQINYGNSYLCNLTGQTEVKTNLSLREIFFSAQARYKVWHRDEFVVFSPECFVRIVGNQISTYPMKGTIQAALPGAEATILADRKEYAEHATIVDLLRNDLGMVADQVQVKRFRYVERVGTHTGEELLQVSSEIVGQLSPSYRANLGDLLFRLLPAGSICGAPKPKTLSIIAEAEGGDRGWYTGVCAFFDGQELDSGVMIRYIEPQDATQSITDGLHHYQFRSGGGLTHLSNVTAEYEELLAKVYLPIRPDVFH